MRGVMLAGTASGAGKTTAAVALIQHLRAQGIKVAAFKAGPDFLDPMHLARAAKAPCENLDDWMMGRARVGMLFAARAQGAGAVVVEGVMGALDGKEGVGGPGSSFALARLLRLPVWLVVPAAGMAGSIAAIVRGFAHYARRAGVRLAGVLASRLGSAAHARLLAEALQKEHLPPLVGWLDAHAPHLPERHLGLVPPQEEQDFASHLHDLAPLPEASAPEKISLAAALGAQGRLAGCKIAVARDACFSFLYPANLAWLAAEGAKVRFFSPLAGEAPPEDADALWLPGGYPELFAHELTRRGALPALRAFAASGRPVLAECGGMMVLGEAIVHAGRSFAMAGVLPCRFVVQPRLVALGYRETKEGLRGHEFHYAVREDHEVLPVAFTLAGPGDAGLRWKGVRASFVHWWFASKPDEAARCFGAA